jgi:hypothetical protein
MNSVLPAVTVVLVLASGVVVVVVVWRVLVDTIVVVALVKPTTGWTIRVLVCVWIGAVTVAVPNCVVTA